MFISALVKQFIRHVDHQIVRLAVQDQKCYRHELTAMYKVLN